MNKLANELNFSAGPGALPESVLRQVQEAIIAIPGVGLSVLGISHRTDWFASVIDELESNIRTLMQLPQDFHVLFLQGGTTQQFSMVPICLLRDQNASAEYLHTGYWSGRSIEEARKEGAVQVLWSGKAAGFRHLPRNADLNLSPDAAYFHYVSNETVDGLQFHEMPGRDDVPRICDMSSDFLSEPCAAERYSLIYAHAQKNIGPAGLTIVLIRDKMLNGMPDDLPGFLDYRSHVQSHSVFNTPPVFAIYTSLLVTRWLLDDIGGLERMGELNRRKAGLMYRAIDESDGFYRGRVAEPDRSLMNATFGLENSELEQRFLADAEAAGFSGLEGHRSIGGLRASLYNGLTLNAVEQLAGFMESFQRKHRR